MAIYHLSVKVISRSAGRSAVAAAAYRCAGRLHDERIDRDHDFTNKGGVVHSEVLLPEGAPEHLSDREQLWNAVEASEKRKDAQLSREVEFAIPRELNQEQGIALARDFVEREFVDRGMIADLNVHWDIGADGLAKPHAHVMLTMREVNADGFGAKVRDWNRTELVEHWRERWAEHVNQRLAELDIDARIDHRSLEAQGIGLEPQDKIGPAASRMEGRGLEAERIEEHRAIAERNGARIIADPTIALDAITHQQATFTTRDLARFVHRHSDGKDQFDAVMSAVRNAPDLVALGKDGRGEERFTSRQMIDTEQRLQRASELMAERRQHAVNERGRDMALVRGAERGLVLTGEQRAAFEHVTGERGLSVVVGYAGTGKSAMLGVAHEAWESAGYNVRGAALSGIAAEGLENGSGIASRTIASLEHQWSEGRELLTSRDVLVIDEAGMVGTRQMERVLAHAAGAGAKVVLVGDPQQLQAIEAGAAFRAIHERHGGVEITEVRRQREDWQRDATRQLATGRTGLAIAAYDERGMVHAADTRDAARGELIERWDRERQASLSDKQIILTHTNDEVRALNEAARERLRDAAELGDDVAISTERGQRQFASGDRIMFLRNDRELGVKNGTLGTVEHVTPQRMTVRVDDGRSLAFDLKDYSHVDHGYAATIHKAQGMTVDRAHVLASPGMDSHGAYVAMSRHRDSVALHYGQDDFADQGKLVRTLSRERGKDMASDYAHTDAAQTFAERRGITFRERVAEVVRKVPEKARSIFANFRPPTRQPSAAVNNEIGAPDQRRAVERYARAAVDIAEMRQRGLPVLPHQCDALEKAGRALDVIRPDAAADLSSALKRQPELMREAAAGRTQTAIREMQLEAEIRTDPAQRANRFVSDWQRLSRARDALLREGNGADASNVSRQMAGMAKSLERDPQMESLLRGRSRELGISMDPGCNLTRDLTASLTMKRSRTLGMEI
ncbi:Ti-type conjugative transfer relaxase TraA [Porphyrobacter sp. ULC335]|uniref:Ti-type conjugative transfer relaxase TraA n=1 Tax=Porphyrobacter sp. ULC335 TaxID=2854260 RepID=UPI00222063D8|nr:Ti-type conjugative transfer relaxase TraA [Porphyrobacter sp. ULC335]UYV15942.1 Ti-type conjugative transfer relaxase TraA [Porphyrobacter sp. ULC335]